MLRQHHFLILAIASAAFLRLFLLHAIPPGLHYDLATNLLIGSNIAFGAYRPIFITAFTGREVMFFYWLALLMRFVGPYVFTLRLVGSLIGLLTVPAAYFAVRHVFAHDRNRAWLAALSAALLAGNLWHVLLSRLGYRLITEPLIQSLALGFLFWGLTILYRSSPSASRLTLHASRFTLHALFALAGLFTGLAAYTYLAARAFPVPLAAALLVLFFSRPRKTLLPITIYFFSALLTFAPLAYFFYTHPDSFLNRMTQVAPTTNDTALLMQSTLAAFTMIFISGDPYERFNYPYRPIFGPIFGAFFVIGVIITVVRLVRARDPLARAAEFMLLVWIPAMLLPTILAVHEIFPSNIRAIGLIPLIFVPTARGLIETIHWLTHNSPSPIARFLRDGRAPQGGLARGRGVRAMALISSISLMSLVISTSSAYFLEWGRWPIVYRDNDADLVAAARWLNEQDTAHTSVFMSSIHYRHPTLAFLARDYSDIRWLTGAKTLALPANGNAIYIFPNSAPPPEEWIADWDSALVAAPLGPDGEPDFRAYRFNSPPPIPPYSPSSANFSNIAELLGYRAIGAVSGESVVVDFYWRVLNPPAASDFRVVADLVDAWGYHWAQGFNDSYPSEQWQADDTLITRVEIPAPVGLPPGDYRLAVTLFAPSTGERLTTIDAAGNFASATANVGPIAVARSPAENAPEAVTPGRRSDLRLGPVSLIGYDLPVTTARPGERLNLALYWHAVVAPRETYIATLTLGRPDLVLESGSPVRNTYPTDQWHSGEIVIDRHAPHLPRDIQPGKYALDLTLSESSGPASFLQLGEIDIQPIERVFTPPAPTHPANLTLGDTVQLIGFDFRRATSDLQPATSSLTLHWHSLAETEADYTVFVHVLDANGQIVAQHDAGPRDNSYPTSLWVQGEYISDGYTFKLPPGTYSLEVGMYLPESGKRLGGGRIGQVVVK